MTEKCIAEGNANVDPNVINTDSDDSTNDYKKMDDALAVFFWALGGSLICMCLLCCMIHYYCPCCYACCESKSKKYTQLNRNSGKMDSNNGDLELVNIENDI